MPRLRHAELYPFIPCVALMRLLRRYRHAVRAHLPIVQVHPTELMLSGPGLFPELFYVQTASRPVFIIFALSATAETGHFSETTGVCSSSGNIPVDTKTALGWVFIYSCFIIALMLGNILAS